MAPEEHQGTGGILVRYRVVTTVAALLLCLGLIACFVPGSVPAATSGEGDGRAALTAEDR